MARRKALIVAVTLMMASAIAIAAAPPQTTIRVAVKKTAAVEPESDEQIVADFLSRKARAEKSQKTILLNLRAALDRKRAEFEDARKRFDEARGRYAEIAGPLPKQGVMSPEDPRLPYEFDLQRTGPESIGTGPPYRRTPPVQGSTPHQP